MTEIEVQGINFQYKKNNSILSNINLTFNKGKMYSILGPNGSGKTTLLSLIAKHLKNQTGSIYVKNKDLNTIKYSELSKEIAIVKQQNEVIYDFSVEEIVMMGRSPYKKNFERNTEKDFDIVKKACEATNVWHLKNRMLSSLSGGEMQRVILARAIAQDTRILLLDEPISSLDIQQQLMFMSVLKKLCEDKNITVITIVHDLNMALYYSNDIIIMKQGEVQFYGKAEEVMTVENIKAVYDLDIDIIEHPSASNKKVILFK